MKQYIVVFFLFTTITSLESVNPLLPVWSIIIALKNATDIAYPPTNKNLIQMTPKEQTLFDNYFDSNSYKRLCANTCSSTSMLCAFLAAHNAATSDSSCHKKTCRDYVACDNRICTILNSLATIACACAMIANYYQQKDLNKAEQMVADMRQEYDIKIED